MAGLILFSSMIIDDFHVRGSAGSSWPLEANAPLHVYADAVLASAIPLQCFPSIASERSELIQSCGSIKDFQSAVCLACKGLKFANKAPFGKGFRPVIS